MAEIKISFIFLLIWYDFISVNTGHEAKIKCQTPKKNQITKREKNFQKGVNT